MSKIIQILHRPFCPLLIFKQQLVASKVRKTKQRGYAKTQKDPLLGRFCVTLLGRLSPPPPRDRARCRPTTVATYHTTIPKKKTFTK